MKRRRKVALPRLTVLSLSRRELIAFTSAIEQLHHLVARMVEVCDRLDAKTPRRKKATVEGKDQGAPANGSAG